MAKHKTKPRYGAPARKRLAHARRPEVRPVAVAATSGGQPQPAAADGLPPFEWMAAFDELDEAVFVHDKDFRVLRCNAAYAACAGQPMEAIVGRPYWQVFPRTSGPLRHCAEAVSRQYNAGTSEFTAASGQIFLSHDITARKPSGEFWYSRHLMENVSARRKQEEAARLRSVFDDVVVGSLPGLFAVTDAKRRLVRWNAALRAAAGRTEAELQDAPLLPLFPAIEQEKMAAKLDEAFAVGHAQGDVCFPGKGDRETTECVFSAQRFEVAGAPYVACVGFDRSIIQQLEADLAAAKALSDTIIESAPGPYYVIDQNSKLVRWNRHLREMTGRTDQELLGTSILADVHEDDRALAAAKFLAAFAMGYAQMEVRVPTAHRGVRVYLKTARRFERDGVPYIAGFCVDVTERKEAQDALAKEKAFTDALVNSVPGAFYVVDREGNYFAWNSYLNRLTGLSDQELRQRSSLLTIEEQDRPLAATTMKEAFDTGYAQTELHVTTRDRGVRLFFMTARRFEVGEASYLVGVGVDTTDRRAQVQRLEQEAHTDPLTHVANRGHFLALAAQEFARSRRYGHPLSLWMIDVDHFKSVNDTYGHHAGDAALQALTGMGQQTLRDWDVMGRMGGEEFAVLLPDTDGTQALLVAERLRQKIATTGVALEQEATAHLTISIGVATMREEDDDIEKLLDRADQALLEAKRTGRDKVCVAAAHAP